MHPVLDPPGGHIKDGAEYAAARFNRRGSVRLADQENIMGSTSGTSKWVTAFAYMLPVVIMGSLTAIYLISPRFYLEYVLHAKKREGQAVEIVTFAAAFGGGLLLMWSSWRVWNGSGRRFRGTGGAIIIAAIAASALFLAGEEISWGQAYFGWKTPQQYRQHSVETNLHNTDIPVQTLGSVFIIAVFFGLPLAWRMRDRFRIPMNWRPAVAEGPVIATIALAFLWKEFKNAYKWVVEADREEPGIYRDFIEQFNEHKEMLIAVGILMYAIYRLRFLRKGYGGSQRPAPAPREVA